jgi:hypothetical protein
VVVGVVLVLVAVAVLVVIAQTLLVGQAAVRLLSLLLPLLLEPLTR